MAKYGRRSYSGKQRTSYFSSKCTVKPNKRMAKYVRNIVSASTAVVVKNPRTDPKPIKRDRPFKRLVRLEKSNFGATGVIPLGSVAIREAAYYSKTGAPARWNKMKLLAATFYGEEDIDDTALFVQMTPTASVYPQLAAADYEDVGDKNHRACIKLIMPPTMASVPVTNGDNLFTVSANCAFADFYVEFV